jgi:uncharacterized membrane protein
MIPWLIFALVAVPLVVVAFAATRRRTAVADNAATEDVAARTEREFAEAEAYEEQWREKNKDHRRERMP